MTIIIGTERNFHHLGSCLVLIQQYDNEIFYFVHISGLTFVPCRQRGPSKLYQVEAWQVP